MHPLSLAERLAKRTGARFGLLSGLAEVLAHPDAVSRGLSRLLEDRTEAEPGSRMPADQLPAVRSSSSKPVPDGSRQ